MEFSEQYEALVGDSKEQQKIVDRLNCVVLAAMQDSIGLKYVLPPLSNDKDQSGDGSSNDKPQKDIASLIREMLASLDLFVEYSRALKDLLQYEAYNAGMLEAIKKLSQGLKDAQNLDKNVSVLNIGDLQSLQQSELMHFWECLSETTDAFFLREDIKWEDLK